MGDVRAKGSEAVGCHGASRVVLIAKVDEHVAGDQRVGTPVKIGVKYVQEFAEQRFPDLCVWP